MPGALVRMTLRRMWDILEWSNDTLSIAWWFLLLLAFLILATAGTRAARKERLRAPGGRH
jgi:hypothetical protein